MKTNMLNILFVSVAFLSEGLSTRAVEPPPRTSLHIGISPFLNNTNSSTVLTNLNRLLLTLPPKVEFSLENGFDGSIIATGSVPVLAYPGPAAQAKALAPQLVVLRRWLDTPHPGPLAGSAALNPPVYLRSVAEHPGAFRPVVLLIGGTLYANTTEPAFDFAPDRLPALSHLVLSETITPFGCAERLTLLEGITVHWCYLSPAMMPFEAYGNASRSWWSHWIQAQGGALDSFSHDWSQISQTIFRLPASSKALDLNALGGPKPKPVMSRVPRRISDVPFEPAPPARAETNVTAPPLVVVAAPAPTPAPAAPSSTPPQSPAPASTPSPVVAALVVPTPAVVASPTPPIAIPREVNLSVSSVGIKWRSPRNDLDISLRLKPGSRMTDPGELYWNTPPRKTAGAKSNSLGRYLHDYREGAEDYEWIELSKGITAATLATDLEVWCDNFEGPGPVTFTAVVVDQGKVIASRDLTITGKGDAREQATQRDQSSSWLRLPFAEILKSTNN